jgi:hypothetical protein
MASEALRRKRVKLLKSTTMKYFVDYYWTEMSTRREEAKDGDTMPLSIYLYPFDHQTKVVRTAFYRDSFQ